MSRTMNASEFKAKCLAELDEVARTGEPITILKRGRPLARVVPVVVKETSPQRELHGTVEILGEILEPVLDPDSWEAERGGPREP